MSEFFFEPVPPFVSKRWALSHLIKFPMLDSADLATMKPWLNVTALRSIDGCALEPCANEPVELGGGKYAIQLTDGDLGHGRTILLRFTARNVMPWDVVLHVVDEAVA